ncbi:TIM-barrel domain-containing protein [Mucilaginibacter sp. PAMB04168]|uniref:glycoside hydrolase family 31 protein n=1 Tax=Mucilaginibacter sp. PAMB04168 TaxID=3138567 RepID=UPI0031F67301
MKAISIFLIILLPALVFAQGYKRHMVQADRVSIELSKGVLELIPLSEKAIRVQWHKNGIREAQEIILINKIPVPKFMVTSTLGQLKVSTRSLQVVFSKNNGALTFADSNGKAFLQEKAGSRTLRADSVSGEDCFVAEQSFLSTNGEALFGLGQFQDGNFNLRNVSRKLTQVNTQIAIPFLYSSKNYGILWHQYGLTYFNPADSAVALVASNTIATGKKADAEVTTTAGTQRVSQQQAVYRGEFKIGRNGNYLFLLDLGDMDNRHLVVIDGVAQIDQSNLWLPPSAGKLMYLNAGVHTVQIVCKATNKPKLTWKPADNLTTFRSPNAKALDYVIFRGNNADEVIGNYRKLSGEVPMLPLWAYGFWQCRERYTSGNHLVETIIEFRKRNLPVDVIVQDWQYWGKYGWGVPKFDEANYPDPKGFIEHLHDLNAHFSVSVWENLDKRSDVAKPYIVKNLYIPNSPWIDIFNPETQKVHWNALDTNLFANGVDSWWMDATEPENDALTGKQTYLGPGNFYRLTYPLFVSKAVYEGQRRSDPQKRVAILTRSAFAGQQRYGTINWSGDIGWSWDTYKRQIVAGLNYNMTGMPYWTTDIGGFFRPGRSQYTDPQYHDLLTRWFQWGTFNPIFRVHGYQSETEPWKYGEAVEKNMKKMLVLRYQLLPYIYSSAWQVSANGSTLMRPLVMDFATDQKAVERRYEYLFGKSMLVAPVTEAGIKELEVYLPQSTIWYDWWSEKQYNGGQVIKTDAPQDKIPVFIKAGAIIPVGPPMQYTKEKTADTLEIRIYSGANGTFELYEDEGDNYNYEKGKFNLIPFSWNNTTKILTIGPSAGKPFPGKLKARIFNIVLINGKSKADAHNSKQLRYNGVRLTTKVE